MDNCVRYKLRRESQLRDGEGRKKSVHKNGESDRTEWVRKEIINSRDDFQEVRSDFIQCRLETEK